NHDELPTASTGPSPLALACARRRRADHTGRLGTVAMFDALVNAVYCPSGCASPPRSESNWWTDRALATATGQALANLHERK
ncbi:MAG: hypothetical protein ABI379_04535, partial [Rhodanobacter sp.]